MKQNRNRRRQYGWALWTIISLNGLFAGAGELTTAESADGIARMARHRSMLCRGDWADGRLGDYILDNGVVRIVIAATERPARGIQAGDLIDVGVGPDYLDCLTRYRPAAKSRIALGARFRSIHVLPEPNGTAEAGAVRCEYALGDGADAIRIQITYRLPKSARAVSVETRLIGDWGEATVESMSLDWADEIQWGILVPLVPTLGFAAAGSKMVGPVAGGITLADDACVGVTPTTGTLGMETTQGRDRVFRSTIWKLGRWESKNVFAIDGWLVVGDRSFSRITDFWLESRQLPWAELSGRVFDAETEAPVAGCPVRIRRQDAPGEEGVDYTWTVTDGDGRYRVKTPPGIYTPWAIPQDRRASTGARSTAGVLKSGEKATIDLPLFESKPLTYRIVDQATGQPCPAKITLTPIAPTLPIDLGPARSARARNAYCVADGVGEIAVAPGRYHVTVTRGIEYEAVETNLTVKPLAKNHLYALLKRSMDTTGYVSVDLGAQTRASYDGLVSNTDRLITAAAEGVEVIVTGDDGVATDLSGVSMAQTLAPWIRTVKGKRIRLSNQGGAGDFLVFPLESGRDHAALSREEYALASDAVKVSEALRKHYPKALIQLCDPLGDDGFFTGAGYDPKARMAERAAWLAKTPPVDFDLLEIGHGANFGDWNDGMRLWHDLRAAGRAIVPVGGSGSVGSAGTEIGYPRLYVASSTDDPAKVSLDEIVQNIRAGRVLITNGPFIRLKVEGKELGQIAQPAIKDRLDLELNVQRSPVSDVNRITILRDGLPLRPMNMAPTQYVTVFPDVAREESPLFYTMMMNPETDSLITATAEGIENLSPLSNRRGDQAMTPFCMTGPIYVDGDGDGQFN